MDAYEATKIVYSRIQSLDPENAAKIMGLLLIQGDDKEMIRLAFLPESLVHNVVLKARNDLGLLPTTPTTPSRYVHPSPSSWGQSDLAGSDDLMGAKNESDLFYSELGSECRSPSGYGGAGWGQQRRGCSLAELYLGEGVGLGWRPCLYYQRGYCKNGSVCRFQHGLPDEGKVDPVMEQQCHELLMRSKSQRIMPSASPFSYGSSLPSPTSGKCMGSFFNQLQQNDNQRASAAAAAMLLNGGDEPHKFTGRHRVDYVSMVNPGSRQIYLTFPADSTFREEDVSNYFSIYGPVQDVRIPYQQKRMFGFVTFVYPETVKLILAKGNPHFVCDARVLVKPYKEKGKIPDKKLQQQQLLDRGDFSSCNSPTGLDSPYDLQQLGTRMLFNNSQEMLLRRKLEEQQQVAELQQAIELQQRRFMGLQLLDLKNRNLTLPLSSIPSPSPISTPTTTPSTIGSTCTDDFPLEEKCPSPATGHGEEQQVTVNAPAPPAATADKVESIDVKGSAYEDGDSQESVEHNLPDSPFATSEPSEISSITCPPPQRTAINTHLMASATPLFSASPALDMASYKSCFLHMPRFPSGHGAVGM